jgi:hypothetical protein
MCPSVLGSNLDYRECTGDYAFSFGVSSCGLVTKAKKGAEGGASYVRLSIIAN